MWIAAIDHYIQYPWVTWNLTVEAVGPYTASQGPEVDVLWDQISKGESIMVVEKKKKARFSHM